MNTSNEQIITFSKTVSQTFVYNILIIIFKATLDYRFPWGSESSFVSHCHLKRYLLLKHHATNFQIGLATFLVNEPHFSFPAFVKSTEVLGSLCGSEIIITME